MRQTRPGSRGHGPSLCPLLPWLTAGVVGGRVSGRVDPGYKVTPPGHILAIHLFRTEGFTQPWAYPGHLRPTLTPKAIGAHVSNFLSFFFLIIVKDAYHIYCLNYS